MDLEKELYYIEKVKNGEANYYSYIVEQYKDVVYSIALKILKNHDDAEELAQESFIKAYKSIQTFKGKSKFSSWLYRITYNSCISHVRKKKHEFTSIDDIQIKDEEDNFSFESVTSESRKELLEKVLKLLPEDDYMLILLYYYEDMSVDEIKEVVDISVSNIKVKLFRARKKLYSILKDQIKEETYSLS